MKTNTTHTPGPWRIYKEPMNPNPRIMAEANTLVVVVSEGKAFAKPTDANARLIASAPELLDALEAMRDAMTSGPERVLRDDEISALMKAHNATAKAEGK